MALDEWSLEGKDSILDEKISDTEILTIVPDETELDEVLEEKKTGLFGGFFSSPKASEVKVEKKKIEYSPYLIIEGEYLARYLRKNTHNLNIDSEVLAIKIKDDVFNIKEKSFKISNLLSKSVSGIGVGGFISLSFHPLEDLLQKGIEIGLGDKDKQIFSKKSIEIPNVLEQALFRKVNTCCFDASTATIVEKQDILKILKKQVKATNGRPKKCEEILNEKRAIEEVKRKLVTHLNGRILEQVFNVLRVNFIFIPRLYADLQYKGQQKKLIIDGITLEVIK